MKPDGRSFRGNRVAVVLQGDSSDSRSWSGTPAGLSDGIAAAGAEPVPIDARFPGSRQLGRALRMSWLDETTNPIFSMASGLTANVSIRAKGQIDGVVSIGSGYSLNVDVPVVTFDDMTVVQAVGQPGSAYSSLTPPAERRWRRRQLRNYRSCRACCATSHWTAHSIQRDYGIDPAKIQVVGLGPNSPRQEIDRDWSTPRFLFIGIDWERKRGPAVLEAFGKVRELHPEATLDLVGGHPAVDAPGVRGHGILALDSVEDRKRRAELIAQATCLVLPSDYEPFGIAYLDAGASGVPSIGTTNGGAPDAVGDGGLLVDPADGGALFKAMLEIADPTVAERLGERAFAHSEDFTWPAVAERVLRALGL